MSDAAFETFTTTSKLRGAVVPEMQAVPMAHTSPRWKVRCICVSEGECELNGALGDRRQIAAAHSLHLEFQSAELRNVVSIARGDGSPVTQTSHDRRDHGIGRGGVHVLKAKVRA